MPARSISASATRTGSSTIRLRPTSTGCDAFATTSASASVASSTTSPPSSQRGLHRPVELLDAKAALQAGGDSTFTVDREQPGLRSQAEPPQGRAEALSDVVVNVDLLVDELDLVAVLLLEL